MQKALDLWLYMYLNLYFSTCSPNELHLQQVWVWMKNVLGPPSKDRPAKKVYTKSERLTVSWGVIWTWSGRLNLDN